MCFDFILTSNSRRSFVASFCRFVYLEKRERTLCTYYYLSNIFSFPQSLFHIPRFCQLILSYHPPPLSPDEVQEYPHCVSFVLELQKLFAFLHQSQRKYISPDLAIQVSSVALLGKLSLYFMQSNCD